MQIAVVWPKSNLFSSDGHHKASGLPLGARKYTGHNVTYRLVKYSIKLYVPLCPKSILDFTKKIVRGVRDVTMCPIFFGNLPEI